MNRAGRDAMRQNQRADRAIDDLMGEHLRGEPMSPMVRSVSARIHEAIGHQQPEIDAEALHKTILRLGAVWKSVPDVELLAVAQENDAHLRLMTPEFGCALLLTALELLSAKRTAVVGMLASQDSERKAWAAYAKANGQLRRETTIENINEGDDT